MKVFTVIGVAMVAIRLAKVVHVVVDIWSSQDYVQRSWERRAR